MTSIKSSRPGHRGDQHDTHREVCPEYAGQTPGLPRAVAIAIAAITTLVALVGGAFSIFYR